MKTRIRKHYRIARYIVYRETSLQPVDHLWTFLGTFTAIASIGLLQQVGFTAQDSLFLIGSFGATCVLLFGAPHSPLAQPRNLVGGHLLAALIGVSMHKLIPDQLWMASALAVALAIVGMQITRTLHPPAGATALIANIGSEKVLSLGYVYIVSPVLLGVTILLIIALLVNNIPSGRSYPSKPMALSRLLRKRA